MPDQEEVSKGIGEMLRQGLGLFGQGVSAVAQVLRSGDAAVREVDGALTGGAARSPQGPSPANASEEQVTHQVAALVRQARDEAARSGDPTAPGVKARFREATRLLFQLPLPATETGLSDIMPSPVEAVRTGLRDLRGSMALVRLANGTGSMAQVHSGHTSVMLDGKVLVVGQYLAEVYDPATGTWAPAGKPVRERARGTTATVLNDGRVLVAGGEWQQGGWSGVTVPVRNVEVYKPSVGVWETTNYMSEPRKFHSAIKLEDGKVLVVGSRELELFNPATDTWSPVGKLKETRGDSYTATQLKDGVVGGKKDTDEGVRGLVPVEIYDPNAKQ